MSNPPKRSASPAKARTSGQSSSTADKKSGSLETGKTADLARDTVAPAEVMSSN